MQGIRVIVTILQIYELKFYFSTGILNDHLAMFNKDLFGIHSIKVQIPSHILLSARVCYWIIFVKQNTFVTH